MTLNFRKNSSHLHLDSNQLKPTLCLTIPLSPSSLPKMVKCLRQSGADMEPILLSIKNAEKVFQDEIALGHQKKMKTQKVKNQRCQSYADFIKHLKKEEGAGVKQESPEVPQSSAVVDAGLEINEAVQEFLDEQSQDQDVDLNIEQKLPSKDTISEKANLDQTHTDMEMQSPEPEITNLQSPKAVRENELEQTKMKSKSENADLAKNPKNECKNEFYEPK